MTVDKSVSLDYLSVPSSRAVFGRLVGCVVDCCALWVQVPSWVQSQRRPPPHGTAAAHQRPGARC